jgi:hypothetical protein
LRANWQQNTTKCQPKVGDVVLIEEDFRPRNIWPMGKIIEVNGQSPNIRSVKLLMPNKRIIIRPVSRIYPLESSPENDIILEETTKVNQEEEIPKMITRKQAKERGLKLTTIAQLSIMTLILL